MSYGPKRSNDANKVPLGRPPPEKGSSYSGPSLLKPSYLMGNDSSGSGDGGQSSDYYSSIPKKFSNEFHSQWGEPSSSNGSSMSSNHGSFSTAGAVSSAIDRIRASLKRSSEGHNYSDGDRGRSGEDSNDSGDARERKRKRRSRWMGSENEKAVIPGMPTILPPDLDPSKTEAYISQLQIEELTRKLRTGDLGIPPNPEDRSPSPEPIYGTDGKRLNTREYRTRKKLEEERHKLIQKLLKINPDYKPPADYRAPVIKIVDRVPIPQEEHPEINFVGLLIGPRGNTLKGLEKDTGAKIIIRGKGSVKEGKVGGKAGHPLPGEDEPLHAYVTSNNPDSVKKACEKIKEIIRQGIDMPESQNDLRKMQLRELALLNGTLREGEGPKCSNCGATSHRTWNCPDKPNVTNNVICSVCGGAGHIAKDCRMKRPGTGGVAVNPAEKAKIDEEYMSLMAELGEGPLPEAKEDSSSSFNKNKIKINLFDKQSEMKALPAASNSGGNNGIGSSGTYSPGKPTAPTPVATPNTGSAISMPPPPAPSMYPPLGSKGWGASSNSSGNQPPPPGSEKASSPGSSGGYAPPMMPPPWGFPPPSWGAAGGVPPPAPWNHPPPPGIGDISEANWAPQPPPPGMFWQGGGTGSSPFGANPPPPPPPPSDAAQPPPPPPPPQ